MSTERRWIPVEERLPELGVDVVVFMSNQQQTEIAWRDKRDCEWMSYAALGKITHWTPLPPLPGEEVQK